MTKENSQDQSKHIKASARFIRVSPFKVRKVADQIRNKNALHASKILAVMPQKAALLLNKVLKSCIANAVNNFNFVDTELDIVSLKINEGPKHKRSRARARGRMFRILKPTAHMEVILAKRGDK